MHHSGYYLIPLIFGTTIPTSFNILVKCFFYTLHYQVNTPEDGEKNTHGPYQRKVLWTGPQESSQEKIAPLNCPWSCHRKVHGKGCRKDCGKDYLWTMPLEGTQGRGKDCRLTKMRGGGVFDGLSPSMNTIKSNHNVFWAHK